MKIFGHYAKYYDLLYRDKDYKAEVEYIETLIKKYSRGKVKDILDIGCGTGNHGSLFAKKGYMVDGIDKSLDMLEEAKKKVNKNLRFYLADATSFKMEKKYDVVCSLFHVINYLLTNKELGKAISNISKHLRKNGLFIFDSWYGPAVLADKLHLKIKKCENDQVRITRISKPVLYQNEDEVKVHFTLSAEDKGRKTKPKKIIKEIHTLRYLFKPEVELFLEKASLKLIAFKQWQTGSRPSLDSWGVCFVGRKI